MNIDISTTERLMSDEEEKWCIDWLMENITEDDCDSLSKLVDQSQIDVIDLTDDDENYNEIIDLCNEPCEREVFITINLIDDNMFDNVIEIDSSNNSFKYEHEQRTNF